MKKAQKRLLSSQKLSLFNTLFAVGIVMLIGIWTLVLTHASTPYTVRYVLFCATDSCNGSVSQVDSYANTIKTYYGNQTGKTFVLQSTVVLQGTHPVSYYLNNDPTAGSTGPGQANCSTDPNPVSCHVFYNIGADGMSQQNVINVAVLGFSTGSANVCGEGGQFTITSGGVTSIYGGVGFIDPNVAGCIADETLAHETGHTFGLAHVTTPTLMYQSACQPTALNNCSIDASQIPALQSNPWFTQSVPPPLSSPIAGVASTATYAGYWAVGGDGRVYSHGDAQFEGDLTGAHLNKPIVGMARTASGNGYWLVAADGGIFSYGDAVFYGSTGKKKLNQPIVGMAATPDSKGYWLVAADGGIFSYGDAVFHGSTGGITLNKPIVGMAATTTGNGYWLVASDGGIFSFGDAAFHGSTGGTPLVAPIVSMVGAPDNGGYWLVASDGGIFSFGSSVFYGADSKAPAGSVAGLARTADSKGYWEVTTQNQGISFGDAAVNTSQTSLENTVLQVAVAGPSSVAMQASAAVGTCGSNFTAPALCGAQGTMGPLTLTAPTQTVDSNGSAYQFSSWTVNAGSGVSCSSNACTVNIASQDSAKITANYTAAAASSLTVVVSGYSKSVTFNSYQHSVGNCDSTIPGSFSDTNSRTCTSSAGHGIGSPDGLYIAPVVPSGYVFAGWQFTPGTTGAGGAATATCTNNTGSTLPSNAQCVNIPAGGSTATITANFVQNLPAALTFNVSGLPYTSVAFSSTPHDIGYCYGYGKPWTWPGSNTCKSGTDSTGAYYPIGVLGSTTTITAPATIKDSSGTLWNFTGWSGQTDAGTCSGTGGCNVYVAQGHSDSLGVNYTAASPSSVTVAVSGYSGTVTFNSYQHSVGNCDSTIPGSFSMTASGNYGTITCTSGSGYGIGAPDGLYISPVVPSGYAFAGWTFAPGTTGTNGAATASCTLASGTTLPANSQCVNIPAGGSTATITASFSINQPAALTIDTTGVTYSSLAFSSSPHDIGYCYGYTQGWQWPGGSNTCQSGVDANGHYYGIGPTYLTAPNQYTDSSNRLWNFTGWSGNGCSGTGTCYVNLSPGQGATVTANYQLSNVTTLYIYLSGAPGQVGFTSSNHTLGYCNPSFQTIYINPGSYAACSSSAGYGIGWSDGLTVNAPSSGGTNYNFAGWSGSSWSGTYCNSGANYYNRCVNMAPNAPYDSITANYSYSPPAPTCSVSGSYSEELCIATSGGYGYSYAYTAQHSLGTCVSSTYQWFYIPSNCNGFQFGPPDGVYIYAENPIGPYSVYSAAVNIYPSSGTLSCYSTYCYANYGNGSYMTGMITFYYQ